MRDVEDRFKLGYERNQEIAAIRASILAGGFEGSTMELHCEVERRYEEAHKNDPTYRERHDAWKARQKKSAPAPRFSSEELEYIAERLAGSNSEVGQRILAKIGGR